MITKRSVCLTRLADDDVAWSPVSFLRAYVACIQKHRTRTVIAVPLRVTVIYRGIFAFRQGDVLSLNWVPAETNVEVHKALRRLMRAVDLRPL